MKLIYGSKYGNKEVDIEPYTTEQEKKLLLLGIQNINEIEFDILDEALKILGYTNDFIINLKRIEKIIILLKSRELSVGDQLPTNYPCKCGRVNHVVPKVGNLYNFKKVDENRVIGKYEIVESFDNISGKPNEEQSKLFINYIFKNKKNINFKELSDMDSVTYEELLEELTANTMSIKEHLELTCICGVKSRIKITDDFIVNNMSEDSLNSLWQNYTDLTFFSHYSKQDVDSMIPFERNILTALLNNTKEKVGSNEA